MLLRSISQGHLCITQPAHAWISGELARAWGNEEFGAFSPWQEVCLGAEQHDIGWLRWETAPTLNPKTGLPHHFTELPTATHIGLWSEAKQLAMPLGRYASLLVSLHGAGLYQRFTGWQASDDARPIVETFLAKEAEFQRHMVTALKSDVRYQADASDDAIARNRQLVATWDSLSLMICGGINGDRQLEHVPTATSETTLTLTPLTPDATEIAIEPWCFRSDTVTLVIDGRVLEQTFVDEAEMRSALANAHWQTMTITLRNA